MNSLGLAWKKLWIHDLFSPIHFQFNTFFLQIHYEFPNLYANSLKFTICFANSPWIIIANWQSTCAFIFNSLFISRIHFQFTVFITKPTMIHYLFGEITNDWLTISWIHYEFPIFFANSLWIHNLFRELTSNSLFFSFHFKFPLHFAKI